MSRQDHFNNGAGLQLRMFIPAGELADHSQYESGDLPAMVRSSEYPMIQNIEQAKRHKVKETMTMGLLPPPNPEWSAHDPAPEGYLGASLPNRSTGEAPLPGVPVAEKSMYRDIKERGVTTPVPIQINPTDIEGITPFILANGNHRVQAAAHINPDMLVPVTWEDAPSWDEPSEYGDKKPANYSHRNIVEDMNAQTEQMVSNRKARQKKAKKKK